MRQKRWLSSWTLGHMTQFPLKSVGDFVKRAPVRCVLLFIFLGNWAISDGLISYLQGDPLGTLPSRDGFVVANHGRHTPVSPAVWLFSLIYIGCTSLTIPALCLIVVAWFFGGELKKAGWPLRLIVGGLTLIWCLGLCFTIGESFYDSLHDWQTHKQPNITLEPTPTAP
jgi:hypothetical protein